jgi:hypothetical protein
MALYTNLPVYKLAYDLLIEIFKRTHLFSREYKYTIGEKLKNETLELIMYIYMANKSKKNNRLAYIDAARKNIELIRLLIRLTKDLKIIANKSFVLLNIKIEELSKQLAAWHKYTVGVVGN